MREIVIQVPGDGWDDDEEAEKIEEELQTVLDNADFDYFDIYVKG